jgi:K+-transporting ATPase ATPase C chain
MRKDITTSLLAILVLTVALGLAYPLATTAVSRLAFPNKSDGSQIKRGGKVVGSRVIGQEFKGRGYFQPRPSVTGYDPSYTYFNNLGPNNKELSDLFKENLAAYAEREGVDPGDVPEDAVQTTASGVDPHISEDNARIQARRVAEQRNLPLERVEELIEQNTDGRSLGVLGEPGVNVLELNLTLDRER